MGPRAAGLKKRQWEASAFTAHACRMRLVAQFIQRSLRERDVNEVNKTSLTSLPASLSISDQFAPFPFCVLAELLLLLEVRFKARCIGWQIAGGPLQQGNP